MSSTTDHLPAWEFANPGHLRERLNGLSLAGRKTVTFDLSILANMYDDWPVPGQRSVMLGSNGARLAIVELLGYEELRLADVTEDLAFGEGESFADVLGWRSAHERFWSAFVPEIRTYTNDPDWELSDDTIVLAERFRIVERLPGVDAARFAVVECIVPAELVEWVSAELIDLGANGIEEIGGVDPALAAATAAKVGGAAAATNGDVVPHGSCLLRAGFGSDEEAAEAEASLVATNREWRPRFEVLLGDEWLDAWREHFEPQHIGAITIVGDWPGATTISAVASADSPTLDGAEINKLQNRVVVKLDPARAFGTGAHASTRLMVEALQVLQADGQLSNAHVLDVGCGSGVLGVTALLLGASHVHGTDIERAALDATLDNASRNNVSDRCTVALAPDPSDTRTYDIVLANILAPVLIELAPAITQRLAPGGTLLLAGLIDTQVDRVVDAYCAASNYDIMRTYTEQPPTSWRCLQLRRR